MIRKYHSFLVFYPIRIHLDEREYNPTGVALVDMTTAAG
jgi:hypothetical protein